MLEIGDFATCEYYNHAVRDQLGEWAYGEKLITRIKELNTCDGYDKQSKFDSMQVERK